MEGIAELMIAALDGLTSGADYEGVARALRAIGSRLKESIASSSLAPVSLRSWGNCFIHYHFGFISVVRSINLSNLTCMSSKDENSN
jgi:hypothetical protein